MSNIRMFPQRQDRANRGAGDWIAAMGRGLTQKEEEQLGAWLSVDKKNYDELMELARLWDEMDALERLAQLFPEPPQPRRQFFSRGGLATAASLVLVCLVFFVLSTSDFSLQTAREVRSVAISESYDTEIGEQAEYSLPDGSIMTLNTNSAVRADFTVSNRVLILQRGELHIAVAHDPDRPLSVIVGNKVVQAVGTEFNVEITTDNSIELIVTDGVVMVGVVEMPDAEVLMDKPLLLTQSSTIVGAGIQGKRVASIAPTPTKRPLWPPFRSTRRSAIRSAPTRSLAPQGMWRRSATRAILRLWKRSWRSTVFQPRKASR